MLRLIFIFLILTEFIASEENSSLPLILKKKQLIVSVGANYEPYYIQNAKKNFPGFEVELAQAFADYLGVILKEVVPLQNFSDHSKAILSGRVDLSFGNSSSLKRGKILSFSEPYYITTIGGLVNKNILPPEGEGQIVMNKQFRNLNDVKGIAALVIGVKDSTSNFDYLKENFVRAEIKAFPNDPMILQALENNDINCYVADALYLEGLLQRNPFLKVRMQPVLGNILEKQLSVTAKKNDLMMISELNYFIREMKRTGEIKRLKEKYFNSNDWIPETKP